MDEGLSHCIGLLREADPDRYLATLYLPAELRPDAAALYAFNAEIARIPALVSEPVPGEIRLQWWREVIEGGREAGDHPVAVALLAAIERRRLPAEVLSRAIDARIFDLYHDPMPDRGALEGYCGETASALLNLVALAAGATPGADLADACGHGGVAQAMAGLVRHSGFHRSRQRCYVPDELLRLAGLTVDEWLGAPPDARHRAATEAMILLAREHLDKSRAAIGRLDRPLMPVFLPLAPVAAYLDAARRAGAGLFEAVPDLSPLRRHFLFWRAAMRGRPA